MTILIATSVVRGSHQGESHGGVYLVDLDEERVAQPIDWNTADIDWQGRGWDRGLRGIEIDGEKVYIAASDELFVYTPDFEQLDSYRNPYLKHCHEICRYNRQLFLTSTGFDTILAFHLDKSRFIWGLHIRAEGETFQVGQFDPNSENGPPLLNTLHINNIFVDDSGLYISGMRTERLLRFNGEEIRPICTLPVGVHNARPFLDGVMFNDTEADVVRFESRGEERWIFPVPKYDFDQLEHTDLGDPRIARQAFGRGLCPITDNLVAAGSSPSTIALHDLEQRQTIMTVNLSRDIRNSIHGLEIWPFE